MVWEDYGIDKHAYSAIGLAGAAILKMFVYVLGQDIKMSTNPKKRKIRVPVSFQFQTTLTSY